MKNEIFEGAYCYFLDMAEEYEWVRMGTCNADDHWEALDKFKRGLGCNPMEKGRRYRIVLHTYGKSYVRMSFVY